MTSWWEALIRASEIGEKSISDDSQCAKNYNSCILPTWVIRPTMATLLYGWGAQEYTNNYSNSNTSSGNSNKATGSNSNNISSTTSNNNNSENR